jgi:hypothetical protein
VGAVGASTEQVQFNSTWWSGTSISLIDLRHSPAAIAAWVAIFPF